MFNWFSNKNYPEYWEKYVATFTSRNASNLENTRFVIFDTETTGLDTNSDRILSIGAVAVTGNAIHITDSFEKFVVQQNFNTQTVKIHGILKNGQQVKFTEEEAISLFLDYIKNSIIVAHHAAFDVEMINNCLKRLNLPKLKNKVLDTGILHKKLNHVDQKQFSLDDLCTEFNVPVNDRHNAMGDAFITAQIFLKMLARMKKERTVSLEDLFVNRNKPGLL